MDEETPNREKTPERAVIKRRWAIVRKAGGGAAVLAIAGAIALGDPTNQDGSAQDPVSADTEISAEA
jgi:hypothetical protein